MSDRLGRADERWYMWLPALASALLLPISLGQYLVDDLTSSLVLGAAQASLFNVFFAPIVATAQLLVPPAMRAFTSAMLVLIVNIFGLSLGPLLTGVASDLLAPSFGADSIRYAVAMSAALSGVAAVCFFWSGLYLKAEIRTANAAA